MEDPQFRPTTPPRGTANSTPQPSTNGEPVFRPATKQPASSPQSKQPGGFRPLNEREKARQLAEGRTNTTPGSQVEAEIAAAPATYLRLDTGEVIGVPAIDHAALKNEFDKWARAMHQLMLANKAWADCVDRLDEIAKQKEKKNNVPAEVEEQAQTFLGFAIEWRDEAKQKVKENLKPLNKLGGAGNQLIELVPLMEKKGDKPYMVETETDGKWKWDKLDVSKPLRAKKGAVGFRDKYEQEERYVGTGKLKNVESDKLKAAWPKAKNEQKTKWSDVYRKDENGKKKINKERMGDYLHEQIKSTKFNTDDFVKLKIENTGTLGPEWLAKWNKKPGRHREGELTWLGHKIGDVELDTDAAAMRYFSGGSLRAEFTPMEGNVYVKAEGAAEVAFAEGKAKATCHFPSKEGLLLYLLDVEQLIDTTRGKAVNVNEYALGAIRITASIELSGVIGASLAGELSIGVEMKTATITTEDGTIVTGDHPHIYGVPKKTHHLRKAEVYGKDKEWTKKAGVTADIEFFAGAKVGIALEGSVQWRNPHNKDKEFENFGLIAPKVNGMAGLAGSLKFAIDYQKGMFRITAHAGVCFGAGAEGEVTFMVGVKQIASFMGYVYYELLNASFASLTFVTTEAFEMLRDLCFLVITKVDQEIEKLKATLESLYTETVLRIRTMVGDVIDRLAKADAAIELAERIIEHPELVRYSPPETKSLLLYRLTRFGFENFIKDAGFGDNYMRTQRLAALEVLYQTQTQSDLDNVIQHIKKPNGQGGWLPGEKGDFERNLGDLLRFFKIEAPGDVNIPIIESSYKETAEEYLKGKGYKAELLKRAAEIPEEELSELERRPDKLTQIAMEGDFGTWYGVVYQSLKEKPTRGYTAKNNRDLVYQMEREHNRDHALFDAGPDGFYSDATIA